MLQDASASPFIVTVVALSGVLLGLAIGKFLLSGSRKIRRLESEIEQMRRDHADYRARVSTHFHTTGELIGQMTASYKAVYDHLSEGAQVLCSDSARPVIAFTSPRLIIAENVEVTNAGVHAPAAQAIPDPIVAMPAAAPAAAESQIAEAAFTPPHAAQSEPSDPAGNATPAR